MKNPKIPKGELSLRVCFTLGHNVLGTQKLPMLTCMHEWPTLNTRCGRTGATRSTSSFGCFYFLLEISSEMSSFLSQFLSLQKLSGFSEVFSWCFWFQPHGTCKWLKSCCSYSYNKNRINKLKINNFSRTHQRTRFQGNPLPQIRIGR